MEKEGVDIRESESVKKEENTIYKYITPDELGNKRKWEIQKKIHCK